MPARPQTILTTGPSGSGKSLVRCGVFLVEEFLPDELGIHFSNFPVNFAGLAKALRWSEEKVRSRVRIIPRDVMDRWADGSESPSVYFKRLEDTEGNILSGAHVAIDEAHRYVGADQKSEILERWKDWIATNRHKGMTVEFLTQFDTAVHSHTRSHAEVIFAVRAPSVERSKLWGILWYDLLQFFSKLWGTRIGVSICQKLIKDPSNKLKFNPSGDWVMIRWNARHFGCYDSYNLVEEEGQGDGAGAKLRRPKEEFERYGWPRFLIWIYLRNFLPITLRLAIVALVVWLVPLGGTHAVADFFNSGIRSVQSAAANAVKNPRKAVSAVTKPAEPITPTVLPEYVDGWRGRGGVGVAAAPTVPLDLVGGLMVVAMIDQTVIFQDGSRVDVGGKMPPGPFDGVKIETVDARKREAKLSNGRFLRVGSIDPGVLADVGLWVSGPPAESPAAPIVAVEDSRAAGRSPGRAGERVSRGRSGPARQGDQRAGVASPRRELPGLPAPGVPGLGGGERGSFGRGEQSTRRGDDLRKFRPATD